MSAIEKERDVRRSLLPATLRRSSRQRRTPPVSRCERQDDREDRRRPLPHPPLGRLRSSFSKPTPRSRRR